MLNALITSKTRIRLLVKFFLNPAYKSYLRELSNEFNESTNSVRIELNRLKDAGLLNTTSQGNTIVYQARTSHPLYPEINSIVTKMTGIDKIVEELIERLGNAKSAYLVGDYAKGIDSGVIDVVLIGDINKVYLSNLIEKVEGLVKRKVRYLVMSEVELTNYIEKKSDPIFLLWSKDN